MCTESCDCSVESRCYYCRYHLCVCVCVCASLTQIQLSQIRVSKEIFSNLTPEIQKGERIQVRPVLVSQGISGNLTHQGHRSLFGKGITDFRNRVNYAAVRHFMSIVNDCMSLPESCAFTPMEKRRIDALTKELKLRLQRSSTQPQAEPGVLMLASDLASTLGASKVTNCMSGKDRTLVFLCVHLPYYHSHPTRTLHTQVRE